jgi:hypothetical protein
VARAKETAQQLHTAQGPSHRALAKAKVQAPVAQTPGVDATTVSVLEAADNKVDSSYRDQLQASSRGV